MSTPDGPRPRWPLRTIGFVLLQLAAMVAVVGLVTVATGGTGGTGGGGGPADDRATAGRGSVEPGEPSAPASQRNSAEPGRPAASPTGAPAPPPGHPPAATSTAPSTRITAPPPAPTAPGPAPGPGAAHTTSARDVRVFNNSTIHGLAGRAAADFGAAGWRVVEVGNYAGGTIPTSTVYYAEGQQASAQAIADEFGMQVRPRFAGMPGGGPGLVVIVTKDYQSGDTRDQIK